MINLVRTSTSRLGVAVVTAIVTTAVIAGGVAAAQVANGSVTTAKIRNGAVTTDKIANGAVTTAKLRGGAVTSRKLADGAVTSAKLANNSVTTSALAPGAVTFGTLAATVQSNLPRHALVSANPNGASLVSGRGVLSVTRVQTGSYRVAFITPVDTCSYTATLVDVGTGGATPGEITVERDSATEVRVRTYDSNGTPQDTANTDGFALAINC